jgi:predicted metallo-beta-lactamase superfamily hydrolase
MNNSRYIVITGYHYDNSCNLNDVYEFANNLEEAIATYESIISKQLKFNNELLQNKQSISKVKNFQWVHIVDLNTKKTIFDSKKINSKL